MKYLKSFKQIANEPIIWQLLVNVSNINDYFITTWPKSAIEQSNSGYSNIIGNYKEIGKFNTKEELEKFKMEYRSSFLL